MIISRATYGVVITVNVISNKTLDTEDKRVGYVGYERDSFSLLHLLTI